MDSEEEEPDGRREGGGQTYIERERKSKKTHTENKKPGLDVLCPIIIYSHVM